MPLSQIEVIQEGLDGMHAMLDRAVPDMTAEQWNARPAGEGVSAFFSLWHYVRTEDNIVNWVVHRRPTVWLERRVGPAFRSAPHLAGHGHDQRGS